MRWLWWLEHVYLVREPNFRLTFPGLMQAQISAITLRERCETSWGTSQDLFRPLSAREYNRRYHEIETPTGGVLRACIKADGKYIAALEMGRMDARHPFQPTDMLFLRLVAPLMGQALRSALDREQAFVRQGLSSPDATGVLIFSPNKTLMIATLAAERWMGLLRDKEMLRGACLPAAVVSALASLRTSVWEPLPHTILASTPVGLLRVEASIANEDGSIAVTLAPQLPPPPPEVPSSWPLTRQERHVCELLLRGHSNRQIAKILVVSENTVEAHCAHVYDKLGVHSRSDLLARFFQEVYKPTLCPPGNTI